MIGTELLSQDLPLYLPGLSTTLSFASLSVRGPFLELLERHLLKLDPGSLRPALKALILSLLPGLEEQNSEEFEQTFRLLDGFKKSVRPASGEDLGNNHNSGDAYFWQCFFLAAITSNGRRLGALAYLTRNLPRLGQQIFQDVSSNGARIEETVKNVSRLSEIVTSPEPGLLLRCFAAGLADEQLLIQRGFLDLLVTHLPLHADVLQVRVKSEDLELLITAAAGVVVRRDMSLNRRLWTWLLGPEIVPNENDGEPESPVSVGDSVRMQSSSRTGYFEEFGLIPLTRALLKMLNQETRNPVERARPLRTCLSLMDRWEIGGLIVPDIFLPAINSIRKYKVEATNKSDFAEVLRSASVFFDGVESGLIWSDIVGLIAQAIGSGRISSSERTEKLSLVSFIIRHFNVREEEMLLIHAPLTALVIFTMLDDATGKVQIQPADYEISLSVSRMALNIATELMELTPERAFQTQPSTNQYIPTSKTVSDALSNQEFLQEIKTFYIQDQGHIDAVPPCVSSQSLSELLLREGFNVTCQSLADPVSCDDVGIRSKLLVTMLGKIPKFSSLDVSPLLSSMHKKVTAPSRLPFPIFTSIISLATNLYSASYITAEDLSDLVNPLVRQAWSFLSASHPKYHVETVRCLWHLQTTLSLSNHEIEASICSLMIECDLTRTFAVGDADPGRSFGVLWTHTLQDNSGHLDRRLSKTSTNESASVRMSGMGAYEVMLAGPLFLLLDALLDERIQLFMTVKTWLQNLVGIDK
jgi:hypothetical protein